MAPCDQTTSSNSPGTSSATPNATSAPPPRPCTPVYSVSAVMFLSTIAGFVIVILATGLLVYIFHKLGWFVEPEPPVTVRPAVAARLLILRETASVAKTSQGLDPAVIRSFPVYTFREKIVSRDVTTEASGLASFRRISREISRSLGSSRRLSRDFSLTRCPSRNGDELAKESAGETCSKRSELAVTIESDDDAMTCRRECAVCLGEYVAGERIKVVPACAHGFHADCIDLWLAAKTTCPICRTDIEPKSPTETIPPNPPIPPQEGLRSEPGGRSSETAAGESAVRGTVGTDGGVAETGAAERQEAALLFAAVAATAGEGEGGDTGDGAALVAAGRRGAVGRPLEWRGKANWQEHEVWSEYDDGGRTEERACCSRGRSTLNKAVIAKEFVGIEAPEECVLFERCIEAGTKCMGWRGEKHIMLGS